MTAEVAVWNKSAIALAADSAVTISRGRMIEKTYNVNKLFTLSKHRPIGVMVYDSAELCGVPWETIIKSYRQNLGKKAFGTTKEYAADLITFVEKSASLFPAHRQRKFFEDVSLVGFYQIQNSVSRLVESETIGGKKSPRRKSARFSKTKFNAYTSR